MVRKGFYLFLLLIVSVVIVTQLVAQYYLSQQHSHIADIGLAYNQQTLSQRITRLALYLERDVREGNGYNKIKRLDTLQKLSTNLKEGHDSLMIRSEDIQSIRPMLLQNGILLDTIQSALLNMLNNTDSSTIRKSTTIIVTHELSYLHTLEKVSEILRTGAEQKLTSLKMVIAIVGVLTLILGVAFVFIFYPLLTEQSDLNIKLGDSLTEMKEASHTKENFLSIISHEIRTPLNSVIGLSNLLMRRNPREDQIEVVKTLKYSADNLLHLVNDILDFNKIQAGKLDMEYTDFSFRQFLQQMYAMFKTAAEDKGLVLKVQADPRIPDLLEGDVNRLSQVFNNLLSNAIKFTHKGEVILEADFNSIADNICNITLEVKDSGIGIAADKLDSVFLPFKQADVDIARKYGGTGLGLSIVKSLVEMLNGRISLSSLPNKGSIFSVELGFKIARHESSQSILEEPHVQVPSSDKSTNVLYIEDVKSNRFLVKSLLNDNGYICRTASSGKEALKITASQKFDLILMDIQMPEMDGYATTIAIRKQKGGQNNNTPVVAFTAEPFSEQLKSKVLAHHISDVITKPFDPDTLLDKIVQFSKRKENSQNLVSFAFYEYAFNNDAEKLNMIKEAVLQDLAKFEKDFTVKNKNQDLLGMREEIHRIRPIVKNLKCEDLIALFDQFRLHESHSPVMLPLANQATAMIQKIIVQISKLDYK